MLSATVVTRVTPTASCGPSQSPKSEQVCQVILATGGWSISLAADPKLAGTQTGSGVVLGSGHVVGSVVTLRIAPK
jgi:hypothetical protein